MEKVYCKDCRYFMEVYNSQEGNSECKHPENMAYLPIRKTSKYDKDYYISSTKSYRRMDGSRYCINYKERLHFFHTWYSFILNWILLTLISFGLSFFLSQFIYDFFAMILGFIFAMILFFKLYSYIRVKWYAPGYGIPKNKP